MRKLVPYLIVVWALIGACSFFVWWKVTRNLTTEDVMTRANRVARELEIPWSLRFKKVRPIYAADFRVSIEGLEAIAADGTSILKAQTAEVRVPWTIFFTQNPVRINVAIDDVNVQDWTRVLKEIEVFLEERRSDRNQQISVPQHIVNSTFNLRLNRLKGPWGAKEFSFDKIYLLNVDPDQPTAFEVVFPWEFGLNNSKLSGETKVLGEYRFSKQKVDLHYYLKNRMQVLNGQRQRSGDFSVEGKGFFHPRMGLFSTLSAKDEWIAFVGDVEWSSKNLKLSVPKFAVSHELVLDLLPFTSLHQGSGPYQSASIIGEFRFGASAEGKSLTANAKTKGKPSVQLNGVEQKLLLQLTIKDKETGDASLSLDDKSLLSFIASKKESKLDWSPLLFTANSESDLWFAPHNQIWNLLSVLPGDKLSVKGADSLPYSLEKTGDVLKVSQLSLNPELPLLNLIYSPEAGAVNEWSSQFDGKSLEGVFSKTSTDFPLIPGHAYTGAVWVKSPQQYNLKIAWKGGVLPLLSKSSCKAIMLDRPELKPLFDGNFAHQVEVEANLPLYKVTKWSAKSPSQQWDISGEWSNSPIKCVLKIQQRDGKKKPVTHNIEMN